MRRLFGSSKKEEPKAAPAPTLSEASAKIDAKVQGLEAQIAKCDTEIKALVAQSSSNPTAKQRALQAMKRKKMYEQQRDQLLGTQFNVEQLAFQQEQAEVTVMAVEAMKAGTQQLKKQTEQIGVDAVDDLTAQMDDLSAEMQEVQEALAAMGGSTGVDESDVADEYAKLEEEMAMAALMGGGVTTGPTGAGYEAAAVPTAPTAEVPAAAASAPAALTPEEERARA
eukprot:TRINITY_DN15184_c0_g1_i1.p1 TRINITY_DN15184_c0_g1~~TRINITY_DN15184_c0_g1_i1.p1  ORF type:complete len:225 (-),score=110.85 TRINITY_DN15184_c0_g1_i1:525-1199(-)